MNFKKAIFLKLLRSILWCESIKSNILMSTATLWLVFVTLHIVEASVVTQRSSNESKAAFKLYLRIQLSRRSEKWLTEHVVVDYTVHVCVYMAVACMYNLHCTVYTRAYMHLQSNAHWGFALYIVLFIAIVILQVFSISLSSYSIINP